MCKKVYHPGHSPIDAPHATRREFLSSLVSAFVLLPWAYGQDKNPVTMAERFRQWSEEAEKEGLAAPFKGVTTNGTVVPGLFQISPSGVSTEPVRNAAAKFISTLTTVQLARTLFPVDDVEWRKWMNQHFYVRQGISFQEMTPVQRDAALGLMSVSLSARGLELTQNIMRLNETLAEMSNDHVFLGEELYYMTIMGRPSATEPWGWRLD